MNDVLSVWIEGVGIWAPPGLANWPAWCALLRGADEPADAMPSRPTPAILPAGERRRVPTHVLAAIEVASQAVAMSGRDGADLPCIFCSAHGDAAIMDYMCMTLATAPREMSPTRFHNSVHNAAAGYWTIASGCHAPSSAVAALECSFGAGLLEAAAQCRADERPVLLVASDGTGSGPLDEMIASSVPFGCALVLAPQATPTALARVDLTLCPGIARPDRPRHARAATLAAANLCARGLPLLEALAGDAPMTFTLRAAPALGLRVHTEITG